MSTMRPEDVAAMFDLPPLEEKAPSTHAAEALEAAEAALAAEFADSLAADGVAADAPDSRTDRRAEVSWPARLRLPDGHVVELRLRNVSEAGVGLASARHVPADTVVDFEMSVPPLDGHGDGVAVKGTIRTTYTVPQGAEILCGGTWVRMAPDGLALVNAWIERLRP